jgi:uncharacterized phage infection (PIP) family protein YhgE
MKNRKILATVLFAFCSLLLINTWACSWISGSTTPQEPGGKAEAIKKAAANQQKAEEALRDARKELERATKDAETARQKAADAQKNAEQLKAETIKAKKDSTNTKQATKTTAAIKDAADAQKDSAAADQKVIEATAKVTESEKRVAEAQRQLEEARGDSPSVFPDWLLYLLIALSALILLALIVYLILREINGTREMIVGHLGGVKKRQDELSNKLDTSAIALRKEFNERLGELKDQVRTLSVNLKDDRREILDGVRRSGAAAAASAYSGYSDQFSVPKENVHTFPAAADEYLSKVRQNAMIVKPDFQNGILVQDPDGKGELVLVEDRVTPGGLIYVVPKVGYFQTKQDFYNYYEKYYECYRPSSGEVWINVPAVVDKVQGGWELRDKGELEIK